MPPSTTRYAARASFLLASISVFVVGYVNAQGVSQPGCSSELQARCSTDSFCTLSPASALGFVCACRDPGYYHNATSLECLDIQDCSASPSPCGGTSTCLNSPGNFTCTCPQGGIYNTTLRNCINTPTPRPVCVTIGGVQSCNCTHPGFALNVTGRTPVCVDRQECLGSTPPCGAASNATCVNIKGGFLCRCRGGYYYDAVTQTCQDADPCSVHASQNPCGVQGQATCVNTNGSYRCVCPLRGYDFNRTLQACVAIDYCSRGVCRGNTTCTNQPGGWRCDCPDGQRYNGTAVACLPTTVPFVLGRAGMAPWNVSVNGTSPAFPDPAAYWIWSHPFAATRASAFAVPTFTRNVTVRNTTNARLVMMVDTHAEVSLNGNYQGSVLEGFNSYRAPVRMALKPGRNLISIRAVNGPYRRQATGQPDVPSPAGLLATLIDEATGVVLARSDAYWRMSVGVHEVPTRLGPMSMAPWNVSWFLFSSSNPASWVWVHPDASTSASTFVVPTFTRLLDLAWPVSARIWMIADNATDVYINGVFKHTFMGGWELRRPNGALPLAAPYVDVSLSAGLNLVVFRAVNWPTLPGGGENPAGFLMSLMDRNSAAVIAASDNSSAWSVVRGNM